MAAMEEQRFDLTLARNELLTPDRRTWPVYDKLHRAERYFQVLSNDDLAALKANEAALRDINGIALSRFIVRLNDDTSAVIFEENHDSLQTLVRHYRPRRLPPCLVKSYIAQMCAICVDLHDRGRVLHGALQLSSFAKEATDHIFLMSTFGVQPASDWRPQKVNPLYLAPEFLTVPGSTCPSSCDMFTADAYSVGLCGLMLATGRSPFTLPYTKNFSAKDLLSAKLRLDPEIPDDLDKELRCLLVHLLERSPRKRMSLQEAILHPALHSYMDSHIKLSSPAVAAALRRDRARRNGSTDPSLHGSETQVVVDTSYSLDVRTNLTRSPTPPLQGMDATAEPFCLWLAEPTGDIGGNNNSSSSNNNNNNGRMNL